MADPPDLLWKMYESHVVHGRHHETQRSTVVGLVLAIATALLGIAAIDKRIEGPLDAVIGAALIGLGIFGAGFTLKQGERWALHMARARQYRDPLDPELDGTPLDALKQAADRKNAADHPWLHKMRLRA